MVYTFNKLIDMKQKSIIWVLPLIVMGAFLILTNRCKKEDKVQLPVLTTSTVTVIGSTTATCGGNITNTGGAMIKIMANGVCWSPSQNPTTGNNKTTDGSGNNNFTSNLTGLTANKKVNL